MKGDWKLLQQQVATTTPAPFELYNVVDDISETNNLAQRLPEKVKQLSALLEAAHQPSPEYPLLPSERRPSTATLMSKVQQVGSARKDPGVADATTEHGWINGKSSWVRPKFSFKLRVGSCR